MRTGVLFVACLCVLSCRQCAYADGQALNLRETMSKVMVESTTKAVVGKPLQLLVMDAYPLLLHNPIKKMYQALKSFWLTLAYRDIERVADLVMEKLREYLFGTRRLQEHVWIRLRNVLRDHLREWWLTTPLVPVESLKTGVWHSLIKLAAEDLPDWFKGTPEYDKLKELVLDEHISVISRWVEGIEQQMAQEAVKENKQRSLTRKRSRRSSRSTRSRY